MRYLHFALVMASFFIITSLALPAGREPEIERNSIIELESRLAEKQDEINALKQELADERSNNPGKKNTAGLLSAGFGSSYASIIYMLLFSIAVGIVSTVVVRRRTQSLCHCLNRRKKLLKRQKILEKTAILSKN